MLKHLHGRRRIQRVARAFLTAALTAGTVTVIASAPANACTVSTFTSTPAIFDGYIRTYAKGSVSCGEPWKLTHKLYRNGGVYRTWEYRRSSSGTAYSDKTLSCTSGLFHSVVTLGYGNGYVSQSVSNAIDIRC